MFWIPEDKNYLEELQKDSVKHSFSENECKEMEDYYRNSSKEIKENVNKLLTAGNNKSAHIFLNS